MWPPRTARLGLSFHTEILPSVPLQSKRVSPSPPMPLVWPHTLPGCIAAAQMVAAAAKNNKFLRNTLMVIILLKANSLIGELLDYFFFSYYYSSSFVDPET